jgi:hypothetical protein
MKSSRYFFKALDNFVKGLYADGTIERWEQQRKMAAVKRNRRRLNRKIKEGKMIRHFLGEGKYDE